MIIVFLILAFLHTIYGVPIQNPGSNIGTFVARDDFAIKSDTTNTRSEYDIVKSCVLTVLACVWTAAHPNIPGPRDSTWTIFKRRLWIMMSALIAPELMLYWALRQRIAARKIADDYNSEVLGLPKEENVHVRSQSWNSVKELVVRVKGWFIELPKILAGRRIGQAWTTAPELGAVRSHMHEIEPLSLRKYWLKMSWISVKNSLREVFIALPKERARRGQGQTWTTTHGFFIQMGGFLLYENDYPKRVLEYNDMKDLIQKKEIDAPIYTEHDLQDRSKGDAISKAVVVFQTTWFVIQCITRLCAGLPLSPLEVVTLGFALLNGIIYAVWWQKPQGVGLAIFIPLKVKEEQLKSSDELQKTHLKNSRTSHEGSMNTHMLGADFRPRLDKNIKRGGEGSGPSEGIAADTVARSSSPMEEYELDPLENPGLEQQATDDAGVDIGGTVNASKSQHAGGGIEGYSEEAPLIQIQPEDATEPMTFRERWLPHVRDALETDRAECHWLVFALVMVPYRYCLYMILIPIMSPFFKMLKSSPNHVSNGAHRIPMFYADQQGDQLMAGYATCAIAIAFGAVHLLAWSSIFPSGTKYWRYSALISIIEPIMMLMMIILERYTHTALGKALLSIVKYPVIAGGTYYAIARITLIVLAFRSLHGLPPSAFITISWTSFIPHL